MQTALFRGVVPFVAVVEAKSFTAAAAQLGITKAAVSKAVRELEQELGVHLLQRSARAVSLTADGSRFYEACVPAVAVVSRARADLRAARETPVGNIKLSLSFVVEPQVVAALARMRERYPNLAVDLRVSDRMARFADEGVDMAIRVGARREASLAQKVLRRTRWTTVASPRYLAKSPPLESVADLAGHRLLSFIGPEGRPRPWAFKGGRAFAVPAPALSVDFGPSLPRAAAAGLGVCQALDFMVDGAIARGELVEVLDELAVDGPNITAVYTMGRRPSANVRTLLQALVDEFARLRPAR